MSCDRTNTTAQSTLKLVATHLIISGKLQGSDSHTALIQRYICTTICDYFLYKATNFGQMIHKVCFAEGVEILCLLGKVLDACKYLQTYDQWQQAAWLAKVRLSYASLLQSTHRYPVMINVYES